MPTLCRYGEPRPPFELKCAYDIVDYVSLRGFQGYVILHLLALPRHNRAWGWEAAAGAWVGLLACATPPPSQP